ncbi:molybdopterin dehydrogenase FAD-binding [Methylobacterium sp. 4-46]|uniref:FAD binding domain-containing protein n=1 Tax=unclassified Methylobacterium TaxID=2615210 RepID=UPI000165CD17|nr:MULTISPECIES: FAD binding domain-containing protein [Methylobacterium]ACA19122.1 molybdopterin dehydrogenase FAD-binding [Methylobacterium sp. 4-46]WFT78333.1 FAD binding domain-containing protein [Methylobacterium nodulans]
MDLNTITAHLTPRGREDLAAWRPGDAWLAGGTWLFSEPQPGVTRLIDLARLGWPPLEIDAEGMRIGATCTIARLDRAECPAAWIAAPLIGQCCRALLGSFKIWTMATVGGNLCMALPAGPMIALTAALDGTCLIWQRDGGERRLPVTEFVRGPQETALQPGEVLRRIDLPAEALRRRAAFRRISLSPNGRSGALLIGTRDAAGALALTVTASTRRPVRIAFPALPAAGALAAALADAIPPGLTHDDVHGAPEWRRQVTLLLAEEIRQELDGDACG